jgi:integrase/recombinase XerC
MGIDIWWYDARGQWCVDVPSAQGRRRLYLGPNEAKAQAELHRYMARYYDDLGQDKGDSKPVLRRPASSISLVELAVRFLKWNEANRSPGTWRSYRDGIKHVTRRHKDKLAAELAPSDIEELKAGMVEQGYAARTINIMVTAIKRMFNWAVRQGLLKESQLAGVEHVSRHVNAPEHPADKHLSLEHALECIETCRQSPPLGDICEMLLLTGMRIGELIRVTWGDVDFSQSLLRLERHKTSGWNNSRPRMIPLCERSMEILERHAPEGVTADRPVFVGQDGQPFTVGSLHCRLRRLREKHSELEGFSFHKLRHTCATYLARLKVPERVAQAILGHSSTLMTRYYTATDKDEMIEAVERLSVHAAATGLSADEESQE